MVSGPSSSSSDVPEIPDVEYFARMLEDVPGFVMRCTCGADAFLTPCPNPLNVGRLGYSCTNAEAVGIHTRKFWDVAVAEEIQMLKDRLRVPEATQSVASYYVERISKLETDVRLMRSEVADSVTQMLEVKQAQQSGATLDRQLVDALWAIIPAAGTVAVVSAGIVAVVCGLSLLWLSKYSQ